MYPISISIQMMYTRLKQHCQNTTEISRSVVDDFLMYYAAEKERIVPYMESRLHPYKKVLRKMDAANLRLLKAEFICHRIFRKDGYIHKYLKRPEILQLEKEQQEYLSVQSAHPWRFTFAIITGQPANEFFEMEDCFTEEKFLLFSPGMQQAMAEYTPRIWFLMLSYNGQCWQTYGPIIPLRSFTQDDIFFFATELNPLICDGESLMKEVEENPFPFFMLLNYCAFPVNVARGFEIVCCYSANYLPDFQPENLGDDFLIDRYKGVYRIQSVANGEFPHFSVAYFHEKKRELLRTSMTEVGFETLTTALIAAGQDLDVFADIAITPSMKMAMEEILNRKIILNPYEKHFPKEKDEIDKEMLARINDFLQRALPYINSSQKPDLEELAEQSGIPLDTALEIWNTSKANIDRMKRGM